MLKKKKHLSKKAKNVKKNQMMVQKHVKQKKEQHK